MPTKKFIPRQWETCSGNAAQPTTDSQPTSNSLPSAATRPCETIHPNGNAADDVAQVVSLIERQGTDIAPSYKPNYQNTKLPNTQSGENGNLGKWFLEEDELPLFPEEVYDHLPPFLDSVIRSAISPSDREVLLIGAITVLSSTLSNVCAAYDSRTVYPNLYLF